MMVSHERDKLINAIVFFARNTNYCGKIKLIKLLYLLDFEHFRQTGRSVTGMDYRAWKMGPVPLEFYKEWDVPEADLASAIDIVPEKVVDFTRETVLPKVEFDDSHFTKRELRIMSELANKLRDSYSKPMVDMTHAERGPWEKIWEGGRGDGERIPYSLAIADDDPHRDAILASASEYAGLAAAKMH
ncbi:MAG: Panacea domain-containing protein [Rhodanobacteraceae bacterium]